VKPFTPAIWGGRRGPKPINGTDMFDIDCGPVKGGKSILLMK